MGRKDNDGLTCKDHIVLELLQKFPGDYLGPTEIGLKLGFPYNSASARVNGSLKRLIKAGKVIRGLGKYRALSFFILLFLASCNPPRDANGHYWPSWDVRHRMFARRERHDPVKCPRKERIEPKF